MTLNLNVVTYQSYYRGEQFQLLSVSEVLK